MLVTFKVSVTGQPSFTTRALVNLVWNVFWIYSQLFHTLLKENIVTKIHVFLYLPKYFIKKWFLSHYCIMCCPALHVTKLWQRMISFLVLPNQCKIHHSFVFFSISECRSLGGILKTQFLKVLVPSNEYKLESPFIFYKSLKSYFAPFDITFSITNFTFELIFCLKARIVSKGR